MTQQVFYVRGFPKDFNMSAVAPDLRVLADLDRSLLERLCRELSSVPGFLPPDDILSIVQSIVPRRESAEAIHRFLFNVEVSDLQTFKRRIEHEWDKSESIKTHLTGVDRKDLLDRLDLLVQVYPAVERFRKADSLVVRTGERLEEFEMICDLRPLFDSERKQIEGLIPRTVMKVVVTGEDGLPRAIEANLSRSQIEEIAQKAANARQKLECIMAAAEKWIEGGVPPLASFKAKESE